MAFEIDTDEFFISKLTETPYLMGTNTGALFKYAKDHGFDTDKLYIKVYLSIDPEDPDNEAGLQPVDLDFLYLEDGVDGNDPENYELLASILYNELTGEVVDELDQDENEFDMTWPDITD